MLNTKKVREILFKLLGQDVFNYSESKKSEIYGILRFALMSGIIDDNEFNVLFDTFCLC